MPVCLNSGKCSEARCLPYSLRAEIVLQKIKENSADLKPTIYASKESDNVELCIASEKQKFSAENKSLIHNKHYRFGQNSTLDEGHARGVC